MKWCVHFPKEEILVKRPCLKQACAGNKNAAALLSFLLYHVSINCDFQASRACDQMDQSEPTSQSDPAEQQETCVTLAFTQREIVARLDAEMSDRTLRETAIPLLVALDYISIDDSEKTSIYTIYPAKVQAGIDRAPAIAEVLQKLKALLDDGKTSVIYQKYFRRLATLLQTSRGKISESYRHSFHQQAEILPLSRGNTSPTHLTAQSTTHQQPEAYGSERKKEKSKSKKETEEGATEASKPVQKIQRAAHAPVSFPTHAVALSPADQGQDRQVRIGASPAAEDILRLVERLRGQRFAEPERPYQLRATHMLMTLQPPLSMPDIQAAWQHGSDEYWRTRHDLLGMTITDLVHHNSHGKRWIFAILEHQQRQHHAATPRPPEYHPALPSAPAPAPDPSPPERDAHMSEQETSQLVAEISRTAQEYRCELHAEGLCNGGIWSIRVTFERHTFMLYEPGEWACKLHIIQSIMHVRQTIATETRAG